LQPITSRYRGRHQGHVAIAVKALGHPLPARAQVHHVNGDGTDNRPSNLVICQDAAYHKLLHARARIVRAGGDPNTERICSSCKQLYKTADAYRGSFNCRECDKAVALRRYYRRRGAA